MTLWLWFTLLFANFAESVAEGRAKAQAASLRRARGAVMAKRLHVPCHGAPWSKVEGALLRKGDVVLVEAGDLIPADGEVIEGVASVDESAITGESAPVIRESAVIFPPSPAAPGCSRTGSSWHRREPRRGVPRPHDRHGRGRQTSEDPKRDRAHHPARGVDAHLSFRHRDTPAFLGL